jgi:hypothetical protein
MKFKITAACLGFIVSFGVFVAQADPVGPFPGGKTAVGVGFPWNSMNGVWEASDSSTGTQFSFEVVRGPSGQNALHVVQFDPNTGAVLGEGVGLEVPGSNIVHIHLDTTNGVGLEITLRSYEDSDSHKRFTMMGVQPSSEGELSQDFLLRRVSKSPRMWLKK